MLLTHGVTGNREEKKWEEGKRGRKCERIVGFEEMRRRKRKESS